MNKQKLKKIIYFAWPVIILAIVYVLGYFYIGSRNKTVDQKENLEQKQAPISFNAETRKYNDLYREALIATRQNDKKQAGELLPPAIILWRGIVDYYSENQPGDYYITKNWSDKINNIFEKIVKAENLTRENNFIQAHDNLIIAGEILGNIHNENNKKTLSDDLLNFYKHVKAVNDSPDKEQVMKILPDLKQTFTVLKEYNISLDYLMQIEVLEKIIGDLDKLSGPDFFDAKNKLEPAFNKIYLEFG